MSGRYYLGEILPDLRAWIYNATGSNQPTSYCTYELPQQQLLGGHTHQWAPPAVRTLYGPPVLPVPKCDTEVMYQLDIGGEPVCPERGGWTRDTLAAFRFVTMVGPKCPTPPPCHPTVRVTVYADEHIAGTYYYEVRRGDGTVVWSGDLARGTTGSFVVPADGSSYTLWLDRDTGPGRNWEHDSAAVIASCAQVSALWNERLAVSCQECDLQ